MGLLTLESFVSSSLGLAVGAVAPSTEAALAMGPAVILIFVVFGGYYVNDKSVPRALQWIPRTSFIKHGFSGLCANELRGLEFEKDAKADVNISTGQQVCASMPLFLSQHSLGHASCLERFHDLHI